MPSRKPRGLKLMLGTLRKDREPEDPLTPRPGKARPPKWLPPAERAAFRQLVTETERTGTPTKSFTHVLTAAALIWIQLERCTAVLAGKGESYETTTTTGALKIVARPEVQLRNTVMRLLKVYLVELGLTPAAIGRLDLSAMPKRPADPGRFERFFGTRPHGSPSARGANDER